MRGHSYYSCVILAKIEVKFKKFLLLTEYVTHCELESVTVSHSNLNL